MKFRDLPQADRNDWLYAKNVLTGKLPLKVVFSNFSSPLKTDVFKMCLRSFKSTCKQTYTSAR